MPTDRSIRFALRAVAALFLSAALTVLAQEEHPPAEPAPPPAVASPAPGPVKNGELTRFELFLDQHPNIEARLRENPDLADNPVFQRNHPQIARFLGQHPGIAAELAARPRWFVHRELVRQSATPITRAQVADFDRFLDQHPGLEKLLTRHPELLRRPDFLTAHPELHEYLTQHAGLDRAAESKPGRLMEREHGRERAENPAVKR